VSTGLAGGASRRPVLGLVLLTGMAAAAPTLVRADGEPGGLAALGFGAGKSTAATAPLPPSPPAAPLPAATAAPPASDASGVIRPATTSAARQESAPAKPGLWNPLQAFGLAGKPESAPATAPQATPRVSSRAPAGSGQTQPRSPAPASGPAGRFDPDFGTAAYLVSDGQALAEPAPLRPQPWDSRGSNRLPAASMPAGDSGTEGVEEPEASASVSDEPVSLVGWLASQYSGQTSGDRGGYCPDVCLKDPCCPTWEAQVDALFLWQGNIPSRPLYVDTVTQAPVLDVNQLQNRAAIAPRYAIIYNRDECRAIEANYFQVWGFNAARQVGPQLNADGNGAFQMNDLAGLSYDSIAGAQATSTAHIQSLEVNLRHRDGGIITWISGFRWVEWGQSLGINDVQYQTTPQPEPDPPLVEQAYDVFNVSTLNNLYGWQWGGDMMLWNSGRWLRINGVGKAGIYYNHQASQNTFYSDLNNPPVAVAASKDVVSFVGETGVNCSWSITNWLSFRGGYSLFWLSGVATPARQLSLTDLAAGTTAVNATGSVLIHGVTTGLEARW
jgi:hypothetical protein